MNQYKLSNNSKKKMVGVKKSLVDVVVLALTLSSVDFGVSEGLRTIERQTELFNMIPKRTWTMNSKHLTGDAIDLYPYVNGKLDYTYIEQVKDAMYKAAQQLGVKIRWGGDWNMNGSSKDEHQRGSYDSPHFELL